MKALQFDEQLSILQATVDMLVRYYSDMEPAQQTRLGNILALVEQVKKPFELPWKDREAEWNAIFQQMSEAVLIYNLKGVIERANPTVVNAYGFDPTGCNLGDVVQRLNFNHLDGRPFVLEEVSTYRALRGEFVQDVIVEFTSLQNQRHVVSVSASPIRDPSGHLREVVVVWRDISAQIGALKELEVQRRLLQQREQERQQIARDLHDGPMQELISFIFTLQELVDSAGDIELKETLMNLKSGLQQQVGELRAYAGELRPPGLIKFGIRQAVESHLEQLQEKHPEIQVEINQALDSDPLEETARVAVFRVYQEVMNNVIRHSQASKVMIRLETVDGHIEMEIRDNGRGFIPPVDWLSLARAGHLGLVGIQERVEAIGGKIKITSEPGQGTSVLVIVPTQNESGG